jgi:aspartyl-tRNA(Asn)/glutamyl-tRNA(Gln) amidotransferase subunit A
VSGLPALSIRAGFDRNGLPIGLQVIGHPRADALVLRAGHAIEALFDGRDAWPDLVTAVAPAMDWPVPAESSDDVPPALAAVIRAAVELVQGAD